MRLIGKVIQVSPRVCRARVKVKIVRLGSRSVRVVCFQKCCWLLSVDSYRHIGFILLFLSRFFLLILTRSRSWSYRFCSGDQYSVFRVSFLKKGVAEKKSSLVIRGVRAILVLSFSMVRFGSIVLWA